MTDSISKKRLENQLEIIIHQKQELVANVNAAEGAIQVLQYLISQLNSDNMEKDGDDVPSKSSD